MVKGNFKKFGNGDYDNKPTYTRSIRSGLDMVESRTGSTGFRRGSTQGTYTQVSELGSLMISLKGSKKSGNGYSNGKFNKNNSPHSHALNEMVPPKSNMVFLSASQGAKDSMSLNPEKIGDGFGISYEAETAT